MSHELSLACYRHAIEKGLSPSSYADLEILLDRLDLRSDTPQPPSFPPRFDFSYHPPSLVVVEDDPDVVGVVLDTLVGWGYPASAIRTYPTGEQILTELATHPISIASGTSNLPGGKVSSRVGMCQESRSFAASRPSHRALA